MNEDRDSRPGSPQGVTSHESEGNTPTPAPLGTTTDDESQPSLQRRRSRSPMRIPDDEVVRPLEAHAVVPSTNQPEITPSRIITISPDPESVSPPLSSAQAPSDGDGTTAGAGVVQDEEALRSEALEISLDADLAAAARERRSDPAAEAEILLEELEAVEPSALAHRAIPSVPPVLPRVAPAGQPIVESQKMTSSSPPPPRPAKTPSRPPLVIVPPHVGKIVAPSGDGTSTQKKGRLWWEDLFNDDYMRAAERIEDDQIAREVDFIENSLGVERGATVLDLACGTGRHAAELAKRGYEIVGFDLSLAMLARAGDEAQQRQAKLNLVQGDMREMTFEQQFDGVYCWNTSFGYFDEEKNDDVISRIHSALKSGGQLLLDVVNRDYAVRHSPSLAWFEGDGCVCMDEMNIDFITSRMRVKRTMMLDDGRSREIEYSMRVYSLHELGKILHDHHFKVTDVTGRIATPGVFFGAESARTIVLAEKL